MHAIQHKEHPVIEKIHRPRRRRESFVLAPEDKTPSDTTQSDGIHRAARRERGPGPRRLRRPGRVVEQQFVLGRE